MKTGDFSTLPPEVEYLIGIDGGGTTTRARVWHRSGVRVGEGRAGPSGLMQGHLQAWRNIGLAIANACDGNSRSGWRPAEPAHCMLGLGLAGANHGPWRNGFMATNPGYVRCELRSDVETALIGAHRGQPGALVILGTGAIALAQESDGQERWVGGWGFPSGDEGAGADLGLRAVRAAQHALDGRGPHSRLTDAVRQRCGQSAEALLSWSCHAHQHEYASLAPLVFDHVTDDPLAQALQAHSLNQFERLLLAVNPHATLPVVVAGSIAQRLVHLLPPQQAHTIVPPLGDALDGALTLCFSTKPEHLHV